MLIIPLRNSINVPLGNVSSAVHHYPPLDGDVEIGNVVKDKLDNLLVLFLADVLDEAGRRELGRELVRGQTVLGKRIVKVIDN